MTNARMKKIRIKTKSGQLIERNAAIVDYITDSGECYSEARVGRFVYRVVCRDVYGAIFAISKNKA
jgi:hypothetical protein